MRPAKGSAVGFDAVDKRSNFAALRGIGHILDDEIEDQVAADVVDGGSAHHGEDAHFANTLAHALENMVHREGALLEELFHVSVVAFGDDFDQDLVSLLGFFGVLRGDFAFLALAVAVRRVGVSRHADEIDDPLEIAFAADGQVDGDGGAPEEFLDAGQGALEIGALAIEFINDDRAGELELVGEGPHLFGLDFDSGDAIDQDQGGGGGDQRAAGVVDKDVISGSIEDVDFGFFPFGHGDGCRDRDFALDFLLVKISDRVALIDAEEAVGSSRGEKQRGCERGLAGIAVAHYTNVPDILAFVDFHGVAPFFKTE